MTQKNTSLPAPDAETVFLVTGGGKGITAENTIALAGAFQSTFLLLGSSPLLEEEPSWARGTNGDKELKKAASQAIQAPGERVPPQVINQEVRRVLSSREIRDTLVRIEEAGGEARYLSADITDSRRLQEALSPHLDSIQGVIHGAGALADKYLREKEEKDFELVYGVKVDGLAHVLELIPPEQLRYLVLFSSVAGVYGNPGQADYSLSNEILNKYAHYLAEKIPDCRVMALDWGPWDGGMVTPRLKRIMVSRGVEVIAIPEGTSTLVDLLSQPRIEPQLVIGNPLPIPPTPVQGSAKTHRLHRRLHLGDNPFLEDHVIGGKAVLPTVCAVHWMVDACEGLFPGYHFHQVEEYQVFRGIIFDHTLAGEYLLEIEALEKNNNSLRFQAVIRSPGEGKLPVNHYQALVELRKDPLPQPRMDDYDLEPSSVITGRELYEKNTLFHGPAFQGVEAVLNHSPEGLTLRCRRDELPLRRQGQFPVRSFDPFVADVHLQSLLIWSSLYRDVRGLPLKIKQGIQYRQPPAGEETIATMRVNQVSNHTLSADVFSHDRQGVIYTAVSSAEITLSPRLDSLFGRNQLEEDA